MSHQDCYGNLIATVEPAAVAAFNDALLQFSRYTFDPVANLDAAIAADPDFVLAHAAKAGLLLTTSERGATRGIKSALDAARRSARAANRREALHLAAAQRWLEGDFAGAIKRYGDIVIEYPRDLLALQIAHVGDFLLGQATMLRDRPAQVLSAWSHGEPGYSAILGMHAFGLEETGQYAAAEAAGRNAVELDPADAWAAHAVAHVCEMQGRHDEGRYWIRSTAPGWSPNNFFAFHNWWHLGLFELERDNTQAALTLYDERIRPGTTTVAMELVDATAMLWRLHLRGADVGDRWGALAQCWRKLGESGFYAFNDVHALMAFLASGAEADVASIVQAIETAALGGGTNAMMSREVGVSIARGLVAFEQGAYQVTIDELQQVRAYAHRFGGSHAQRDLVALTLAEAALRAGQRPLARALAAERLALKPRSAFNWRMAQRAEALGGAPRATCAA